MLTKRHTRLRAVVAILTLLAVLVGAGLLSLTVLDTSLQSAFYDKAIDVSPAQVRNQITIVAIPQLPADDPFWQRMQALWAAQRARGHVPRSAREVEEERQAVRDEWEDRMRRIEQLQDEAARARRGAGT